MSCHRTEAAACVGRIYIPDCFSQRVSWSKAGVLDEDVGNEFDEFTDPACIHVFLFASFVVLKISLNAVISTSP